MATPQHPQTDLTVASTSFFLDVSANQARSSHSAVQALWQPRTGKSSQQRQPASAGTSTRKLVATDTAATPVTHSLGCHGSAVLMSHANDAEFSKKTHLFNTLTH